MGEKQQEVMEVMDDSPEPEAEAEEEEVVFS